MWLSLGNIYCTHGHGFDRLFGSVFDELSVCQVIPTLTREQQVNFDVGLYAVTNQLFKEMPGFMQNFQNAEKMLEQLRRQGGHFRTKQECSSSHAAGYVQPGAKAAVVDSDQNEGDPTSPSVMQLVLSCAAASPLADEPQMRDALCLAITAASLPVGQVSWQMWFGLQVD